MTDRLTGDDNAGLERLDEDVQSAVAHAWAAVIADDLDAFNAALTGIQLQHAGIGLVSMLVDLITCALPVLTQRWGISDPSTIHLRFRDPADRLAYPDTGPAATRFVQAALAGDREAAVDAFTTFHRRGQVNALVDLCWGWLRSLNHDEPLGPPVIDQ